MNKTKALVTIVVAATAIFALAGCSTVSKTDALEIPNSVLELTNGGLFEESTFGYVTSDGEVVKFTNCDKPSIFDQNYCVSEDGVYKFQWSTRKSRIRNASITVDGSKHDLDCSANADDVWSNLSVCVPTN